MTKTVPNLVGRTFTVISQTDFRLILESDYMGAPGNSVLIIEAKSIQDADHGILKLAEAVIN